NCIPYTQIAVLEAPFYQNVTLSLHDALPICSPRRFRCGVARGRGGPRRGRRSPPDARRRFHARRWEGSCPRSRHGWAVLGVLGRSEEHTSELQSRFELVCRLLLEKKNNL